MTSHQFFGILFITSEWINPAQGQGEEIMQGCSPQWEEMTGGIVRAAHDTFQ